MNALANVSPAFVGLLVLFMAGFAVFEIASRMFRLKGGMRGELIRKAGHIISAVAFAFAPLWMSAYEVALLAGLLSAGFLLIRLGNASASIKTVSRISWGELFFPLGVGISALVILPQSLAAYQAGILILGFADAAAALVGKRLGSVRLPIGDGKKTLEGSVAFFVIALLVLMWFGAPLSILLLLAAVALASVEAVFPYGLDNLVLPVAAGGMLLMLL